MITKEDIIAIVVWYHPTQEQADNIRSYGTLVRKVIIIDNSDTDNHSLLQNIQDIPHTYVPLFANRGIAYALNQGCQMALQEGSRWFLTMDQDSQWQEDQWRIYLDAVNRYPDLSTVGVFSPRQDYANQRPVYPSEFEEKLAVMTSGCLLSAHGFQMTNGFREELFIDEVDNEYCFHCRRVGLKIIIVNHAFLAHHLGETVHMRFLGIWTKEYNDHASFRYYYIVRNNLLLSHLYPEYKKFNNKRLNKTIKRIVLYDRRHKWQSLRMCLRGWCDFRRGKFGALNES